MNRKLIKDLMDAIKASDRKKTSGYDTSAVVQRIEDGTAWVHIPGGVDETPVKLTINASVGDTVQVRVSGGRAFLVGNRTAPPTDDTTAIKATYVAKNAQETAVEAKSEASEAWHYAGTAKEAAESAQDSADSAAEAAIEAWNHADDAHQAAISANNSANNALVQLSVVEDVAGTLRWISEHGSYVPTTDTTVIEGSVYFIYENGDYIPIANPDPSANPSQEGWYVLDVTSSQSEYIMAHLAVTSAGLWVLPFNAFSPHPLVDSADNDLIDSDSNQLVDWSKDPQNANGYKVLLASDGMTIYDDTGASVAHYGVYTRIGTESGNNVYIDSDSVDIREENIVLASFGTDGVLLYRKVNDSSIPIAKFTTDQYGNPFVWMAKYPNTPGGDVPYTSIGTVLDTTGLHTYGDNSQYIDPAGISKAKYTYGGIYYNDWSVAVGTKRASESNSTVGSSTWSAQEVVNLTPGTWLVIFGCGFASHATGDRYITLNKNSSGNQSLTRHDMIMPAINGAPTYVQATKIVQVSDSEGLAPYYLHVYQNSGTTLATYPFIEAIKLV